MCEFACELCLVAYSNIMEHIHKFMGSSCVVFPNVLHIALRDLVTSFELSLGHDPSDWLMVVYIGIFTLPPYHLLSMCV